MRMVMCYFVKQKTAYEMRISDWSSDVCSSELLEGFQRLHFQRLRGLAAALRQEAAHRVAALEHVLDLRRLLAGMEERDLAVLELLVGDRDLEAVAERLDVLVVHLLGAAGRVERLAGRAHAVALDRLGQDHGGHALGVHCLVVGGGALVRVVAAAVEADRKSTRLNSSH